MIGTDANLLVAPSSRDHSQQVMDRRLRGEEVPPVEYELLRRDGTTFYGETTATIMRRPDGKPTGYICNTRDTTERRRAEAALRESEARYRDLFDGAIEGIYETSREGVPLTSNPALAHTLGYAWAGDAVPEIVVPAPQVWADEGERERFMALLNERGIVRGYECQFVRADGRKIWVSLNSRVVRGDDGEALHHAGFVEDITDRKLAAEALLASELRLERTLEGAVVALGTTTELRDPYTSGHQQRVAELACALAGELGCDQERLGSLRTAARLHDIGKIVVPAEILSKPGRLSEPERRLVQLHPAAGAEIVGAHRLRWRCGGDDPPAP